MTTEDIKPIKLQSCAECGQEVAPYDSHDIQSCADWIIKRADCILQLAGRLIYSALTAERDSAVAEVVHWKANHDNQVRRKREGSEIRDNLIQEWKTKAVESEKVLTHWIQQGYEFREEIDRLREALQAGYNHITTVGSMDDIQGAVLKLMSEALATKPSEEATDDHD